jgi:hypothetical protein
MLWPGRQKSMTIQRAAPMQPSRSYFCPKLAFCPRSSFMLRISPVPLCDLSQHFGRPFNQTNLQSSTYSGRWSFLSWPNRLSLTAHEEQKRAKEHSNASCRDTTSRALDWLDGRLHIDQALWIIGCRGSGQHMSDGMTGSVLFAVPRKEPSFPPLVGKPSMLL